ncbi:hypothetical protein C7212DRAFT_361061 [Tuber magnatum]|uniref:Uncharacterized protein n=1 Tax=Tuber magnatum TaxID=42249 RepID=A0A317T054_9PEZI|nr:hypothetical protein C7212DRAFT_361061 [Tuber magnatum]
MSDNHKQSLRGCDQFSVQPEFNYAVDSTPQLSFDGHQGQSHGFVQCDSSDHFPVSNLSPYSAGADPQHPVQAGPSYRKSLPQNKFPQRVRSYTLPGTKSPQPKVFEGHWKTSWNRSPIYVSGTGIPSSQNDPYAGVRKWNEFNAQQPPEKNSNNPPLSRIPPTNTKPIPLGPRYTRTRRKRELYQQIQPPNSQHIPNPRHSPPSSHTRSQPCLEEGEMAENKLTGPGDNLHVAGGLGASGLAQIGIPDPTATNPAPRGGGSPGVSESPTNRGGSSGSGSCEEYVGFIIPSDPYTIHSVEKGSTGPGELGTDSTKVTVREHNSIAGKAQVIALNCQQPAPKVGGSNTKMGSLLGAVENPMSRGGGGGGSGINDEYWGFIMPSDPYTFYPVQKGSASLQSLGTNGLKAAAGEHHNMAWKDQVITLICQQPERETNDANSKTGSFLGATENHMSKDGSSDSGANDEYMGFIMPSDPYTFYPVQKGSTSIRNLGADHTTAAAREHNSMEWKDQVIALICQPPAPEVSSSNTRTGSLLIPGGGPVSKYGGGDNSTSDEYVGFILPSDPYTLHPAGQGSTNLRNSGKDHTKAQVTETDGGVTKDQVTAPVPQRPALKIDKSNPKTARHKKVNKSAGRRPCSGEKCIKQKSNQMS